MKLEVELAAMKRKFAEKEEIEIELKNQLQKQTNRVKKMNDESHLIFEENKLLKHQVSALLEGGATATIRRKFDPSMKSQKSVKNPEIAYPPSMNKIDRDQRDSGVSAQQQPQHQQKPRLQQQQQPHQHQQNHQEQQYYHHQQQQQQQQQYQHYQQQQQQRRQEPPQQQAIPNRQNIEQPSPSPQHIVNHTLHGRGLYPQLSSVKSRPKCPVCTKEFPIGFSDASATQHVNEHFIN